VTSPRARSEPRVRAAPIVTSIRWGSACHATAHPVIGVASGLKTIAHLKLESGHGGALRRARSRCLTPAFGARWARQIGHIPRQASMAGAMGEMMTWPIIVALDGMPQPSHGGVWLAARNEGAPQATASMARASCRTHRGKAGRGAASTARTYRDDQTDAQDAARPQRISPDQGCVPRRVCATSAGPWQA
jgi:hypothetical protein